MLKEQFTEIADRNLLTNEDALMIIEILNRACARKKAEIYEDIIAVRIDSEGDAE